MSEFEPAVDFVLDREGGLVKNPNDLGGITNHGISLRFLKFVEKENLKRAFIFGDIDEETIRSLSIGQARALYLSEFWERAPFEKIVNQEHCNYIFDMAVNLGISPAIKCVQRACWAVMKKWELLPDDGILGDHTVSSIRLCGFLIMPALRAERANYYRNIVNTHPEQKEFLRGWYDRTYST
jgi:lysozyme family protein